MPPVGLEPATLTPAAQTITQLTKWTGGENGPPPPFRKTQNGMAARDGREKKTTPHFYSLKTERADCDTYKWGISFVCKKSKPNLF